jgi:hypothetical protein
MSRAKAQVASPHWSVQPGGVMLFSRFTVATFLLTSIALGVVAQTSAKADSADDALARVQALEKEIAAIKKENEALRQVKKLREENASLKSRQVNANSGRPALHDPREAYAADLPVYVKAAAPPEQGRLRLWGEGGAIWSGGDPIDSFYTRSTLSLLGIDTRGLFFPLLPKVGWEAATGFDYRFAGSPWHVSGQFRYGEGRTTETSASSSSSIFAGGAPPVTVTITVADAESVSHQETHWLADLALGRDVIGSGADAMQFKFGVRVAELRAKTNSHASWSESLVGDPPSNFLIAFDTNISQELKFLGAGPRFGVEGSVPMARGWSFDYLGDVAALFGTQNFYRRSSVDNLVVVPIPNDGLPNTPPIVNTAQKFATVLNADIQVGVSYWLSQNMKASLSYRLDAYFNAFTGVDAKNDPKNLVQINRYIHGPRLALTGQF